MCLFSGIKAPVKEISDTSIICDSPSVDYPLGATQLSLGSSEGFFDFPIDGYTFNFTPHCSVNHIHPIGGGIEMAAQLS